MITQIFLFFIACTLNAWSFPSKQDLFLRIWVCKTLKKNCKINGRVFDYFPTTSFLLVYYSACSKAESIVFNWGNWEYHPVSFDYKADIFHFSYLAQNCVAYILATKNSPEASLPSTHKSIVVAFTWAEKWNDDCGLDRLVNSWRTGGQTEGKNTSWDSSLQPLQKLNSIIWNVCAFDSSCNTWNLSKSLKCQKNG